jgi:hypothetical protein
LLSFIDAVYTYPHAHTGLSAACTNVHHLCS